MNTIVSDVEYALYISTKTVRYPFGFLIGLWTLASYALRARLASGLVTASGIFYAGCSFAKREQDGFSKIVTMCIGGSGALLFAVCALLVKRVAYFSTQTSVFELFSPSEANVLGIVFTKSKCFSQAQKIFHSLKERKGIVTDATLAFAYKWYAEHPSCLKDDKEALKQQVRKLAAFHALEWSDAMFVRLEEFVGELSEVKYLQQIHTECGLG